MKKQLTRHNVLLLLFLLCTAGLLLWPSFPGYSRPAPAPLYRGDLNRIHNFHPGLLPFYEKLRLLKKGQIPRVTVLHIGDSHIQPDSLSGEVRHGLQALFGNGGRGLCFPYRLARTNGPADYRITSNVTWEARRSVQTDNPLPVGLSGFTLRSRNRDALLDMRLSPGICGDPQNDGFDTIIVFHDGKTDAYGITVSRETGDGPAGEAEADTSVEGQSRFTFPSPRCQATLTAVKTGPDQTYSQIYGISLERSASGLLYHSAGVNGADFDHFTSSEYFSHHLDLLKPDLVIVSLGTNTAFGKNFTEEDVRIKIQGLFRSIRSTCPDAVILFTTPPDALSPSKKRIRSNLATVRALLTTFCRSTALPYWDLYAVMGGSGSAMTWRRAGLIQSDMVHFTRPGYELQGKLFATALVNGYRSYESQRD